MGNSFERPVGAPADAYELEYISALHQTDTKNGLRRDGSIQAIDIRRFLKSRYGIRVSVDEVRQTILRGLGGGDNDDGECLDLVEIVGVLLIPLLLRAVRERGVGSAADHHNADGEEGGRRRTVVINHGDDEDGDEFEDNETRVPPPPSSSKTTKKRHRRSSVEAGLSRSDFFTDREYNAFLDTAKKNKALQPSPQLIDDVLNMILVEATGSAEPRPLTKELIRSLFEAYGEVELVDDEELIDEMMALAMGGRRIDEGEEEGEGDEVMLDADAFARALTQDVTLYDPDRELDATTMYYDVFGTEASTKERGKMWEKSKLTSTIATTLSSTVQGRADSSSNADESTNDGRREGGGTTRNMEGDASFHGGEACERSQAADEAVPIALEEGEGQREGDAIHKAQNHNQSNPPREVTRDVTFDSIDYAADTYRSKTYVILSWVALVFSYISYVSGESSWMTAPCDGNDSYGCQLARGVLGWTFVLIQLSVLGSLFMGLLSMGNSIFSNSVWEVGAGMAAVTCFTILPYFIEIDLDWVNTTKDEGDNITSLRSLETLILVCGSVLLSIQVVNLLRIIIPRDIVKSRRFLNALLQGGNARAEFVTKQACTYKVNRLVRNAYAMHQGNLILSSGDQGSDSDDVTKKKVSIYRSGEASRAMVNFDRQATEVETTGGFWWVWKSFVSGTLFREEGVWLHGRLVAGNLSQFFVCFLLLYIGITWSRNLINVVYTPPITEEAYEALDVDGSGTISFNDATSFAASSLLKPIDIDEITELVSIKLDGPSGADFCGDLGLQGTRRVFTREAANGASVVSDKEISDFFEDAEMQFSTAEVGIVNNVFYRDVYTIQQFWEVFRESALTTVELSMDQVSVLDHNSDGEVSFDDMRKLLKSVFQLGIPSFEADVLVEQHGFTPDQSIYFWRLISTLDSERVGYPTPEAVNTFFDDVDEFSRIIDKQFFGCKCHLQQMSHTESEEVDTTEMTAVPPTESKEDDATEMTAVPPEVNNTTESKEDGPMMGIPAMPPTESKEDDSTEMTAVPPEVNNTTESKEDGLMMGIPSMPPTDSKKDDPTRRATYDADCIGIPFTSQDECFVQNCERVVSDKLAISDFCSVNQNDQVIFDACLLQFLYRGDPHLNTTTSETFRLIFDALDKDEDGILRAPDVNGILLDVFNKGKNLFGSRNIDPEDMSDILSLFEEESVAFLRGTVVEVFFNKFDEDCDGELSREELFLNWFQLASKVSSPGKCNRNQGNGTDIGTESDGSNYNLDDNNGDNVPPPATTRLCGCGCGEFCNITVGEMGNCQLCSRYQFSSDCDNDGLNEGGAKDCKERCFGSDCEVNSIDDGGFEEEEDVWDDITSSISSVFITEDLDDYSPEEWMFRLSLGMGVLGALAIGMVFSFSYIPSTVSITLQFRSGVLPSLRDANFNTFRKNMESVTMLFGSIFWGMLFTSVAVFLLVGGVTFVLVWQGTRELVISITAIIIGVIITILLKMLIVKIVGATTTSAYYRKKPHTANIAYLALECWHLGITAAFMLARAVKIIVAAAIFLGRIDRDFLAPGVGKIGPVVLDQYPTYFKKDILSADAHRHPYLERLGLMYMMKLRFGDDFGRTSGSCWRLLFVFALMPWLRKYRILGESQTDDNIEELDASSRKGKRSKASAKIAELQLEIAALVKQNRTLKKVIRRNSSVIDGGDEIELLNGPECGSITGEIRESGVGEGRLITRGTFSSTTISISTEGEGRQQAI